ncbi:MAG: arylsulfatase [Filimonas sp.]|nr:arylsulfatase [Filimonas sp.]
MRKLLAFIFILLSFRVNAQQKKPNIVYIYADDLGYGDLGCYGQQKIETPNIDALAANGKKFTQHYAFPVCAPSRYILMTGKSSGHAYIRGNNEWGERGNVRSFKEMEANPYLEGQWPIPGNTITIPKMLKKAGYATALVGKWGLGAPMTAGTPNKQGFDYFYGFICQRQDHTYYPGHLWENEDRVPLNNKILDPNVTFPKELDPLDAKNYEQYQQNDYASGFLINAAINFIDKNKQQPFFLYYASPLPHVSLQAPQKWIDYYHKKFGDEKPFLGGDGYFPCRYPRATYAAMIAALDEEVGQIINTLKKNGLYENTIILFSSDNGPTYNGGSDSPWFNSAGPFSGEYGRAKGFVYEGGIRTPFIVQWPGKISAGTQSDMILSTMDAMPTLCDIAGITAPTQIDGVSYLNTLLGKSQQKIHDYLYFEFPEYGGQQAVRMGKWKAIRTNIHKGNMAIQLYDLDADLKEQNDVAAMHPDIVKQIENILKKEHTKPEVSSFIMKPLEGTK